MCRISYQIKVVNYIVQGAMNMSNIEMKRATAGLCTLMVLVCVMTVLGQTEPASAEQPESTWQAPKNWDEFGTVRQWREADAKFYRSLENAYISDESMFKFDQVKIYGQTRRYAGSLEGVGLSVWLELSTDEQEQRRRLAGRELNYLGDLRNKIGRASCRERV